MNNLSSSLSSILQNKRPSQSEEAYYIVSFEVSGDLILAATGGGG